MNYYAQYYLQQLRTVTAFMLQYRAALGIWMIGHVLEPLVYLIVWSAVAAGGGSTGDYSPRGFAAYFIVIMLVNHATYTWIMWEHEYRVRDGTFSIALLRPVHPIHSDISDNLASKVVTLPIILAAALVLAAVFRPDLHPPLWAAALFLPSVALAFLLRFLVEWTVALAAFWTTRVSAINQVYYMLLLFLSGQLAPLAMFPAPIRALAAALPFRWMIAFPAELLLGRLTPAEALAGLCVQAAWAGAALLAMRLVWRAGVKAYTAVGA